MSLANRIESPQDMPDHFASAHDDGAVAYGEGVPIRNSPYGDSDRGCTLGRAWQKAWRLGWVNAERDEHGLDPVSWRDASGFYSYPTDHRP